MPKRKGTSSKGTKSKKVATEPEVQDKPVERPTDVKMEVDAPVKMPASHEVDDEERYVEIRTIVSSKVGEVLSNQETKNIIEDIKQKSGVAELLVDQVPPSSVESVVTWVGMPGKVSKGIALLPGIYNKSQQRHIGEDEEDDEIFVRLAIAESIVMEKLLLDDTNKNLLQIIESGTKCVVDLSSSVLPLSTDRSLQLKGSSNRIEAALYKLLPVIGLKAESNNNRTGCRVDYSPVSILGVYGHPDTFVRQKINSSLAASNPYIVYVKPQYPSPEQAVPPEQQNPADTILNLTTPEGLMQAQRQAQLAHVDQLLTQHIFIATDLVGSVIGRGGVRINEIRTNSGAQIRINEPTVRDNIEGRVISILGKPKNNQMALLQIYGLLEQSLSFRKS